MTGGGFMSDIVMGTGIEFTKTWGPMLHFGLVFQKYEPCIQFSGWQGSASLQGK